MGEPTHRSDVLLSQVGESGSIVLNATGSSLSHSVHLLVQFSSVMETEITSSGDSPPYSSWMPRSNTTYSSVTSMGLLRQMFNSEPLDDSLSTMTSSDSHDVYIFILVDD